jgi:hypothetical protein
MTPQNLRSRAISTSQPLKESTGPSQGPVVLDIGGSVGAAVIITGADLDGTELEVRRLGTEWDGTHVAVRSRPTTGEPIYAAVFSQLHEGVHEFRRRPVDPLGPVHQINVVGGELVELRWSRRTTSRSPVAT